jgi:hypothetical protein
MNRCCRTQLGLRLVDRARNGSEKQEETQVKSSVQLTAPGIGGNMNTVHTYPYQQFVSELGYRISINKGERALETVVMFLCNHVVLMICYFL